MIVSLNETKGSFCSIGTLYFSFVDPGPKDVDIDIMDTDNLNQLLYNLRKGVLKTTDRDEMLRLRTLTQALPAASTTYSTPEEMPLDDNQPPPLKVEAVFERMEEEEKELKVILKGTVATVKNKSVDLSASQVRKLLDLELQLKKRATIIKHLEQLIIMHQQTVQQTTGTVPLEAAMNQADLTKGLKKVNLDNVGDVVESEVEQIVLNPMHDDEE